MIKNPRATLTNNRATQVAVSSRPAAKNDGRKHDRRVQIVKALMEANSHRGVAVEEVAKTVGLASGRFAHLPKTEIGISPQCDLDNIRLEKAKQGLENGVLSIK